MDKTKFAAGQKYNKLTLIKLIFRNGSTYKWLCKCDCGKETIVRTAHLKGHTQSCGCQKHLKNNAKDLVGQKFGQLIVLERDFEVLDKKRAFWKCRCNCGKIKTIRGKDLLNGKIRSCTCWFIESKTGKNNHGYRHDLTPEERYFNKYRQLITGYLDWVKQVKELGNNVCLICSSSKKLQAHHIQSFSTNRELVINIDNGICLCRQCHLDFHRLYGKKNNTQQQLDEFKSSFYTC